MAQQGKGRSFVVKDDGWYGFNLFAAGGEILLAFMAEKDHKFLNPIKEEWRKNGNYTGWDDVEKRVPGFARGMLTKRNKCSFHFNRFSMNMRGSGMSSAHL